VLNSVDALKKDNLKLVGANMYETHRGLQHLYEVSCPELDFLVDFSEKYNEIIGARMLGGGFGGCTINIIHKNVIARFVEEVSSSYFEKFKIKLTAFEVNPSGGTSIKRS
jgi:galactokinase